MNDDVFLSLLALDAYNRGYGQDLFLEEGDSVAGQNELGRHTAFSNTAIENFSHIATALCETTKDAYLPPHHGTAQT